MKKRRDYQRLSKEKKIRKKNMLEIDIVIHLKKKNKKRTSEKSNSRYVSTKITTATRTN